MPPRRAAVVIGVNKTGGGLLPLESAAAGAGDVAGWLKAEGFEVTTITDAAGKVEWKQIADAVAAVVEAGNCHQLVIYFSGHGFWKNDTELWLLSDAPVDANAAVSWAETAELAKDCGIPNVVLISDACRSIPVTPQQLRVRGALVFPNEDVKRSRARIDKFMGAAVVPNRRLGKYLQREVGALLASVNITLDQAPDAEVLSDDDVYIGRVRLSEEARWKTFGPESTPAAPVIHLRDVATAAVSHAMNVRSPFGDRELHAIQDLARTSGFNHAVDQARTTADVTRFDMETGFAIIRTSIDDVATTNGAHATIMAAGDRENPGVIRIESQERADAVALRFGNGRGSVLAAIRGFIGHILMDGNSIINVTYVPSHQSGWRRAEYEARRDRIDGLRAAAAAAVRHGVFRLDDRRMAFDLARRLRLGRSMDPTLGLYAAYAYAEADRREDVEDVDDCLRWYLDVELFDVALLSRRITQPPYRGVAPFCPMLTQGWNLLRAHRIELPPVLNDAQDELEPALWTTFKPARMQMIIDAIRRGELT